MKAVAICWSFGRLSVCELLGMWLRQSEPIPLVVWLDVAALGEGDHIIAGIAPHIRIVRAERRSWGRSLAAMRNASIAWAADHYSLADDDVILPIEDDDFYASNHVACALGTINEPNHAAPYAALHSSDTPRLPGPVWSGSRWVGQQWARGERPEHCRSTDGPGPHAQWAYRLGLFTRAGRYPNTAEQDDMALASAMNWARCKPRWNLTYVRREHALNLSRNAYNVEHVRRASALSLTLEPTWNHELEALERWCRYDQWAPGSSIGRPS